MLYNPEDFVRLEIASALKREIRVIPVLVDGASMPQSRDLPDDLKALVYRQALLLSHDRFRTDSERLEAAVKRVLEKAAAERRERLEAERSERQRREQATAGIRERQEKQQLDVPHRERQEQEEPEHEPRLQPVTPSPPVIAAPRTIEEEALPIPEVAVQPSAQPTTRIAVAIPSPSISAMPTKEEMARRALDNATKDSPWVNSLGMKFVPVAGMQVLFSVWDTRVQDIEKFATSGGYSAGADWENPGFNQGPTYPVVNVSWDDAKAFCEWLTKAENASGELSNGSLYRLPTDQEWSVAVGLPSEPGKTPQEKDSKIKLYPWGTQRPPPKGAGNYCGAESDARTASFIKGYKDDYVYTSPSSSFAANHFGLYDMGGNVWQWCEDWYNSERKFRVLRGASWKKFDLIFLLASYRGFGTPVERVANIGFRCVVVVAANKNFGSSRRHFGLRKFLSDLTGIVGLEP